MAETPAKPVIKTLATAAESGLTFMNTQQLINSIADALDDRSIQSASAATGVQSLPADVADALFLHELSKPIEKVLKAQPEFAPGACFMIQQANGYTPLNPLSLAPQLVRVARDTSPAEAMAWLHRVLSIRSASGLCVSVVWGLKTDNQIELPGSIRLVPLGELPDSPLKKRVCRNSPPLDIVGYAPQLMSLPPESALVKSITISPVVWDLKQGPPPKQSNPLAPFKALDDARLALTLLASDPPLEAAHWFQFEDDPDLQWEIFNSGIGSQMLEVTPFTFEVGEPVDPSDAVALVGQFQKLKETLRDRMKIALDRLNQAMRRTAPGDRAIDLSIALEALLVDDRGEHTYKVGLRAALLVGKSTEERISTRAIVSAVYSLRSAILHSGRVPGRYNVKQRGQLDVSEIVKEATGITQNVLREILFRGNIPDWYAFETGGPISE